MIHLTRLNRTPLFLNSDLIEHLQSTPDTVITLTSGHNFMVLESPEEIISRIVQYRHRITLELPPVGSVPRSTEAVDVDV
jgi:flagellar protein FlbD